MNIAIYSRKSKFTGKGDSIENQIQLCRDYLNLHYPDATMDIYEDEGFSGKNTDRPQFKQLMKDAKSKKFQILICYRLDRISRNIADFSSLIEKLQDYDVGFISLKEQFDTTTPMGRAMMYISGVFAQLERETIAERVRDNMLQLSKSGRWLGGTTPTGFTSEEVSFYDGQNSRKLYKLVPIEGELDLVSLIFDKFNELKSLTKLETYLIQHDIKTKNNKNYCIAALRIILTNPVYASGDIVTYEYLTQKGCILTDTKSDFNGLKSLMPYNRTNQSKKSSNKQNPCSEWIVALAEHKPLISGQKWVEVQILMDRNKDKSFRKVRSQEALLSGILRCSHCGSYMRPKQSRMSSDGTKIHYYYICELKEKSKGTKCNVKNIAGHVIDHAVLDEISKLANERNELLDAIKNDKEKIIFQQDGLVSKIKDYKATILAHKESISNLLKNLSESTNPIANKYILDQVETLGLEIQSLESKVEDLEPSQRNLSSRTFNLELMQKTLSHFKSSIETATITEKRELVRVILESAYWDGTDLDLNMFGVEALKKH